MYKLIIAAACSILTVSAVTAVLDVKSQDSAAIDLIDIYERPADGVGAGETVDKQVGITNKGNTTVYVRIEADKSWTLDGVSIPDMNTDWININLPNKNDWVYGGDGYYYYQYPLEPGDTTSDLMNSFTISDDYKNILYPGIEGNIIVSGESVAFDGFTPEYDENGKIIGWGDISFDIEVTITSTVPLGSDVTVTDNSQTATQITSSSDITTSVSSGNISVTQSATQITSSHESYPATSPVTSLTDDVISSGNGSVTQSTTLITSSHESYPAISSTNGSITDLSSEPAESDDDMSTSGLQTSSAVTSPENTTGSQHSSVYATNIHIPSSPGTGDSSSVLKLTLAALSAAAAALFSKRKKP